MFEQFQEGDILKTYVSSEWDEQVPRTEIAVVENDQGQLWAKSRFTPDWHELHDFKWERIGNVHINPEILEQYNA